MAQYYLAQNGQKAGPFSVEQLLQNGLNPNSLVFTQGMTAWTKASEVPELAAALAPAPLNIRHLNLNTRLHSHNTSNPINSLLWATMWQLHKWTL